MVKQPEEYRWSSYGSNVRGDTGWATPHEEYLGPGRTLDQRCTASRELFEYQIDGADLRLFRKAAHYCQSVGDDRFLRQMEEKFRYSLAPGSAARGLHRSPPARRRFLHAGSLDGYCFGPTTGPSPIAK